MKIAVWTNPSAAAYWRLIDPLRRMKGFDVRIIESGITEEIAKEADIYVLQSCVDMEGIALLYQHQQENGKKIVVDTDDYLELNEDNPHAIEHKIANAKEIIIKTLEIADAVTTTTDYLANKLKKYNKNIYVLPNYMDMERWAGRVSRNTSSKVRIGWVGSMTHKADIELVAEDLKKVLDRGKSELVLVGDIRFREVFKGYRVESMLGVPFGVYPMKLRGLQLDIGIAPLVDNEFNRCKSNIKALEYGLLGIPAVLSDVEPYKSFGDFVSTNWVERLNELVENKELRLKEGKKLQEQTSEYDLSKHVKKWEEVYRNVYLKK